MFLFMLFPLPGMLFLVSPAHLLSHVCHRELAYTTVGAGEAISIRLLSPYLRLETKVHGAGIQKGWYPKHKERLEPSLFLLLTLMIRESFRRQIPLSQS